MYNENKYMQLSRDALIRGVQDLAVRLLDQKEKKRHKTTSYLRSMAELGQARQALITKLSEGDRNRPDFFPLDALIEYKKEQPQEDVFDFNRNVVVQPPRPGKVVAHEGDMLVVHLDGDPFPIKVWPAHVKLRFIRTTV